MSTVKKLIKLIRYINDPEFNKDIDGKTMEIIEELPSMDIGNQLALFGNCLLLQVKNQTVILDDSCFTITLKKGKLQMLPKSKIIVSLGGNSRIEGEEKTDNCYELSELGKAAGEVIKDEEKDHTPVHHSAHITTERG